MTTTLTPFLAAQVIGFPIAFLLRGAIRLWRSRRGEPAARRRDRFEAGANACFAAMSIAFTVNRPLGVLMLLGGIGLTIAARVPGLGKPPPITPGPPTSIRNSKLARKRRTLAA